MVLPFRPPQKTKEDLNRYIQKKDFGYSIFLLLLGSSD